MIARRSFLLLAPALLAADGGASSVRGRLRPNSALIDNAGATIVLVSDQPTASVLADERVWIEDFEARGKWASKRRFAIDPIYTSALFVWRGNRRLAVTYFCETCSIRSATPGPCQCCQEEMKFDPRDPALKDSEPPR